MPFYPIPSRARSCEKVNRAGPWSERQWAGGEATGARVGAACEALRARGWRNRARPGWSPLGFRCQRHRVEWRLSFEPGQAEERVRRKRGRPRFGGKIYCLGKEKIKVIPVVPPASPHAGGCAGVNELWKAKSWALWIEAGELFVSGLGNSCPQC